MAVTVLFAGVTRRSIQNGGWLFALLLGMAIVAFPSLRAFAQSEYPSRPVQLTIAYGAGSVGDVSMRVLAERLSDKFGKPVVVDNKPGAGGIVAAKAAASAAPDGHTLLLIGNSYAISAALFKSLPYNIVTDFTSVSSVATFDMLVIVKEGSPLKSMQDVVAYGKAHPGKLNIATLSPGTTQFVAAQLFKITTGIDITLVPFRTSPDMATALLRGDVDVALEFFAPIQSLLQSHKIEVLATTGRNRVYFLPEVPTVIESGIPNFDVSSWNGIAVPAGTPRPIIDQLSAAVTEVLKSPEAQDTARRLGMEMRGSTPEELAAKLQDDIKKWTDVVERAHIPKMD